MRRLFPEGDYCILQSSEMSSIMALKLLRVCARALKNNSGRSKAGKRCTTPLACGAAQAWRAQWHNGASTPSWRRARGRSSPRRCAGCAAALWAPAAPVAFPEPRAWATIDNETTNGPRGRGLVSGADDGSFSSTRGRGGDIDNITSRGLVLIIKPRSCLFCDVAPVKRPLASLARGRPQPLKNPSV